MLESHSSRSRCSGISVSAPKLLTRVFSCVAEGSCLPCKYLLNMSRDCRFVHVGISVVGPWVCLAAGERLNGDRVGCERRSVHRCRRGRGKGHVSSPIPPPPLHRHHTACLGFRHTCPLVLFAAEMLGALRVVCFGQERGAGRVGSLRRGWPPNCWVQYFLCNWRRRSPSAPCPAVEFFLLTCSLEGDDFA